MRVAIIHDSFLYLGGAERVSMALLGMFPGADLYAAFLSGDVAQEIKPKVRGRIVVSPFNVPFLTEKMASYLKPVIYHWWETLDLSAYDLIISSSHAFSSKSVVVPKKTIHVSYIHSPPRYLYGLSSQSSLFFVLRPFLPYLRRKDVAAAQRPDMLVANSKTVQGRIKRWYHRESTVIYPPARIPRKLPTRRPSYYLCFSHLLKQKNIDLAIRACNTLQAPLVVVGGGPEERYLRGIAGPTITFLGILPDSKIDSVYSGAIALLYPSEDEDFGIVPVEAMAHGVPVIAYRSGGTTETVIEKKNRNFF